MCPGSPNRESQNEQKCRQWMQTGICTSTIAITHCLSCNTCLHVQQCLDELVGEVFTTDPFLRSTLTAPSIAFVLPAVMCRSNLTLRGFSSKNELPSASSAQSAKGYFMLVNNPIKHGSFRWFMMTIWPSNIIINRRWLALSVSTRKFYGYLSCSTVSHIMYHTVFLYGWYLDWTYGPLFINPG